MTQDEFNQKNKKGEVEIIQEEKQPAEGSSEQKTLEDPQMLFQNYVSIMEVLRKIKKFRTTAPTNVPKTYLDAIEFYVSGSTYRVYFYINKTWKYITLT